MRPPRRAAACLLLVLTAGCSSGGEAPAAPSAPPGAVGGFRVAVRDAQEAAPGPAGAGKLAWRSSWRLAWEPVPGATSYAVRYGTNEGAGDGEPALQDEPELVVEAAAGTSPRTQVDRDRRAALLFTSSQLLVSVSARSAAGEGPRSLWFPVGDAPATGRPVGSASLGEHDDG